MKHAAQEMEKLHPAIKSLIRLAKLPNCLSRLQLKLGIFVG
jgi:hypothetical protein